MKNTSRERQSEVNYEVERLHVKDLIVEKMKFQNDEFGYLANGKLSDYMREMDGVVGISEEDEALTIEYDLNTTDELELNRAAEYFKNLF
ncbi:hypothetical protein [Sporosalibacterium faouarense]|uniref:hypothetical protein n=1 Tax=Sporosalibacterium faouarense TaxID=516123 RepID=UPI00192AF950|nr:hypothetical protein [Sporosalibacterium faouarense]